MRDKLFFHVRNSKENVCGTPVRDHTYCVKYTGDALYVGYAITSDEDTFCKKIGRELAEKKATILESIPKEVFKSNYANLNAYLPTTIAASLYSIIDRSKEILHIGGAIDVRLFANDYRSKIPTQMVVGS